MDKDIQELKAGLKKFKPNTLDEVKADAKYNYLRQLKEQREKAAFEEAKIEGNLDDYIEELKSEVRNEQEPAKKGK